MDLEKVLTRLLEFVPEALAAYVFGSYASGDFQAHSDLDISVLLPGKGDPLKLWQVAGELAEVAGVPVDLVDLGAASTVMQYQIITTGRQLWARDTSVGLFEAFVLSEKTSLDTARAGLLGEIRENGVIHGR
ncbi:nucleotidyltransferase domain-containing protein [Pseudomonas sp. NFR16]|uniref:type VII toxin-antitoxin system MntA family adenylyltransferase antitoxin n=1 Tax=Pseudomonas sp. NFR16 TaxID=1566248 RepID=UPI0008C4BA1A|nr:nucleotidyltransferase domain-containing protein [Pseudomonas sp. NFR16]SEJ38168.1 Nucleotidyltransferase domain-containing protein [Pseudomonas sp. NFR16]